MQNTNIGPGNIRGQTAPCPISPYLIKKLTIINNEQHLLASAAMSGREAVHRRHDLMAGGIELHVRQPKIE